MWGFDKAIDAKTTRDFCPPNNYNNNNNNNNNNSMDIK